MKALKRVVIVGAGFAGLNAAKRLGASRVVEATLIDRRNYHLFQPLLYQVAMAGLSPAEIAAPIRSLLSRYAAVRVVRDEVVRVDLEQREVAAGARRYPYDYLILACGAGHTYFGNDSWEEHAPGLKTVEQATEIRRRVLDAFEEAEKETDPARRKALLTFVVVGGGPTGVELAGAIGEMSRFTLARDFRNVDPKLTRIVLVEGGPRILPGFSAAMSSRAMRDLESLGVQVWTSSAVTHIDGEGVNIGEERIRARTTLWAAGVEAAGLGRRLGVEPDHSGRVPVEPDLSLAPHREVFVVGDMARFVHGRTGPLPGIAPVAIQEGEFVAGLILDEIRGRPRRSFRYIDRGQMATIGRRRAVVEIGRFRFGGFLAWILWLLVHIYHLVGFKNRLFVVLQWAWSYLTFRRGARLIVGKEWRQPASDEQAPESVPAGDDRTPRTGSRG